MKQALIVVDMQEVFFNNPENDLYEKERVLKNINRLIDQAHNQDIPVIFIQHTSQDPDDELFEGTFNWQLHKNLNRSESDQVIRKTTRDAFYRTELHNYLKENKIDQLTFAGAQTEFCLDTTIRAAYSLGYQQNRLFRYTHSTLDSSVLKAQDIIDHHESIWNNRFLTLIDGGIYL